MRTLYLLYILATIYSSMSCLGLRMSLTHWRLNFHNFRFCNFSNSPSREKKYLFSPKICLDPSVEFAAKLCWCWRKYLLEPSIAPQKRDQQGALSQSALLPECLFVPPQPPERRVWTLWGNYISICPCHWTVKHCRVSSRAKHSDGQTGHRGEGGKKWSQDTKGEAGKLRGRWNTADTRPSVTFVSCPSWTGRCWPCTSSLKWAWLNGFDWVQGLPVWSQEDELHRGFLWLNIRTWMRKFSALENGASEQWNCSLLHMYESISVAAHCSLFSSKVSNVVVWPLSVTAWSPRPTLTSG